jgi:hypothetical protein
MEETMSGTTANDLGSVQKTLLLPLWGRAVETKKARPLLVDQTAVRITESIDHDFSTISRNTSFVSQGLKAANSRVIKAGGMDDSAVLRWGLRRAHDMEQWDSRITVVAEYPVFRNMRRGLSAREKWGTFLSDVLHIMSMVHLRLGGGQ